MQTWRNVPSLAPLPPSLLGHTEDSLSCKTQRESWKIFSSFVSFSFGDGKGIPLDGGNYKFKLFLQTCKWFPLSPACEPSRQTEVGSSSSWSRHKGGEKKIHGKDSSGCPVVKTLCVKVGGAGSIPGQEQRSHKLWVCETKQNKIHGAFMRINCSVYIAGLVATLFNPSYSDSLSSLSWPFTKRIYVRIITDDGIPLGGIWEEGC